MADRLTGKAGYIIYNGYTIPITKWTSKTTRNLPDSTDTGDYNQNTDLIYHTRIPVSVDMEVTVEGRYRRSTIPGAIISVLFTGANALACVLGLDASTVFGHGNFDLSDFTLDLPSEDVVTYTCTLMSNGVFTPGQ